MKNVWAILGIILFWNCQSDDVCVEGSTPNLVIKTKSVATQDSLALDTLIVVYKDSDNENQTLQFYGKDSIQIPLRIDGGPISFSFATSAQEGALKDSLLMQYTPEQVYVSKACGLKQVFNSVSYQLIESPQIQSVEPLVNNISNSDEVHLYLWY